MKKLLFLLLFIHLFAFNPNSTKSTILITDSKYAIINNRNIQNGMTGYVTHNSMIIAKALSLGDGHIKYLPFTALKNEALATPKVMPKKDDNIIFGLYNKRALIISPNQDSYIQTQNRHPNINWISSDIFASYFENKPTTQDFQNFCSDVNVGVIDFVLDKEYIVDCQSMNVLEINKIKPAKYSKPFFCSYNKFGSSFFSSTPDNWIKYYKSLLKVPNGK